MKSPKSCSLLSTKPSIWCFLCQPNNPTGQIVTSDFLEKLLKKCRACHATPVIDECFLDFLPEHESRTAKRFLAQFPELVILKAFTKLYAMAGVRLGYVLQRRSPNCWIRCRAAGQPWAVSRLLHRQQFWRHWTSAFYVVRVQALNRHSSSPILNGAGCAHWGLASAWIGSANYTAVPSAGNTVAMPLQGKTRGIVLAQLRQTTAGLDGSSWYRTAVRTRAGKPAAFLNLTGGACYEPGTK